MQSSAVDLDRRVLRLDVRRMPIRGLLAALIAANVLLSLTTALFIREYQHLDQHGTFVAGLIEHGLVQFHLATENVLAAWYSSMLLLGVALLALAAFVLDGTIAAKGRLRYGWLLMSGAFAVLSLDEIGSFHERIGMMEAGGSGQARGWVQVLAVPIALVAGFMLAFAWLHVRRVPRVFGLMAVGVALFLANPALERIELAMVRGGADLDSWQITFQRVIEEGLLELMGMTAFIAAVLLYLRDRWRGPVRVPVPRMAAALCALMSVPWVAGLVGATAIANRLPPGDTGIPAHWFPASACLVLCVGALMARAQADDRLNLRLYAGLAAAGLCLSGWFGAGLHGYTTWGSYDMLRAAIMSAIVVAFVGSLTGLVVRGSARRLAIAAALLMVAALVPGRGGAPALAAGAAWLAVAAIVREISSPEPSAVAANAAGRDAASTEPPAASGRWRGGRAPEHQPFF